MRSTVSTRNLARVWIYALLSVHGIVVLLPMVWLLATSLKDTWSIFQDPWALPKILQWVNYEKAWITGGLGWKFWNSLVVDAFALVAILLFSSMAAYVLARFKFPGNRLIYYLFLGGMALPVFLGIVPLFLLMTDLGLLNTRAGLILVYTAYMLSFPIFILYGFFKTLPNELAEAALIDGCSPFGVFWRVMLPLAKPGIVTAGIFVFIGLWNEFPLALVFLSASEQQTLPVGIASLTMTQRYQADWGALFAALTISVIPTVVFYMLFQRQIQAGLTSGALKR